MAKKITQPMNWQEGADKLLKVATPEEIVAVGITSRSCFCLEDGLSLIEMVTKEKFPDQRKFYYTPPDNVGNAARARFLLNLEEKYRKRRKELIPEIQNPRLTYIIFDDLIETGSTLKASVDRLVEQDVGKNKIWAFIGTLVSLGSSSLGPFLDKSDVFLRYAKQATEQKNQEIRKAYSNFFNKDM